MSYTYSPVEGQSMMEFIYDPRGYPYINHHSDEGNWSASMTYPTHKHIPIQHIQPQAYLTQYNNIGTDWFFSDQERNSRYMSPSDTYSSSRSEVSTPHDTSSAASITHFPSAYSPGAIDTVNPLSYETFAKQMYAHREMPLAEQDPIHMPLSAHDQIYPFSSHSQPVKEFELDFKDEEEADEETIRIHSSLISAPQEVEFPTVSTTTPMEEHSPRRNKRARKSESDDEHEPEEDDNIAIDDVADSDWTAKPKAKRRRSSRGSASRTPRQRSHKKSISNGTSPKKTLQDLQQTTAPGEMAPPRHKRVPSKSSKKIPAFAKKSVSTLDKKDRSFPCTFHHFGCQSVFPNKNEWKRHVACQHLQLGFYRCDLDACNPDNTIAMQNGRKNQVKKEEDEEQRTVVYNDFNRKDLFTQHARRMHGPTRIPSRCSVPPTKKGILLPTKEDEAAFERELLDIRRRCWMMQRNAPSRSNCGICNTVFDATYYKECVGKNSGGSMSQGPGDRQNAEEKAWEERMEHVGRHYEKGDFKTSEDVDEDLIAWGLKTGVMIELPDGQPWLAGADLPSDFSQAGDENHEEARKTRRQPSRTVVKQPIKKEEKDVASEYAVTSDEDAPAESD